MFPETAEQLMRSRYSAFVLKNIPYIVQTTVPSQQTLLDEKPCKIGLMKHNGSV